MKGTQYILLTSSSNDPDSVCKYWPPAAMNVTLASKTGLWWQRHGLCIVVLTLSYWIVKLTSSGSTRFSWMFVYSDVADYTYVGNITAPILRIVSYKQSKSSTQSHQEFVNLHYVPLAKSYIDQVHIDIKDEIGRSVPFVGGKTLVKLHFKRIKS